jgi:hypothetical protein
LYSPVNVVWVIKPRKSDEWQCRGKKRNIYTLLMGKHEGKKQLGKPTWR